MGLSKLFCGWLTGIRDWGKVQKCSVNLYRFVQYCNSDLGYRFRTSDFKIGKVFVIQLVKNSEIDENLNRHFTLVHSAGAVLAIGSHTDFCVAGSLVVVTALPDFGLHARGCV